MKRVVQVYKPPGRWVDEPPGWGDFLRGVCGLLDLLRGTGVQLRVDVSCTGFGDLIVPDEAVLQSSGEARVAAAREYFEATDHVRLRADLDDFLRSGAPEFHLCTNVGDWNRLALPADSREFARRLYRFRDDVEQAAARPLPPAGYEVLSVRCGDRFFDDPGALPDAGAQRRIFALIERHVLPRARHPIVATSDSQAFKLELARRYGMTVLPHQPRHGAFGDVRAVAMELCVLKRARYLYHVNDWAKWWSGFSHYTGLVFGIPEMNFRAPFYDREEVTGGGRLIADRPWWRVFSRRA